MSKRSIVIAAMLLLFMETVPLRAADANNWKEVVAQRLPLYGHRNWIVIADSAYPAQSSPGIETIVSGAGQMTVLHTVLSAIAASKQVRPVIYTDRELKFVSEQDAPGIQKYREALAAALGKAQVQSLPHEELISKLDEASRTFRILLIKTNITLPYTSVFVQLRASYWSDEAEQKLRAAMASKIPSNR